MISEKEGQFLLGLARESVSAYFSRQEPDITDAKKYSEKRGVFVSLHKKKDLRGCIGFPEAVHPLYLAVIEAARSAAFHDPRFPPLSWQEYPLVDFELSVLTVPAIIANDRCRQQIKIGKHGLIIRHPDGSGLLLPQVAVEWGWNCDEFLQNLCRKAGLCDDAWCSADAKLFCFEAQVFSEG